MQGGNDVDYTSVYQQVADTADGPLSDAPKGGGVKFAPERQSGEKRMNSTGCFFINLEAVTDSATVIKVKRIFIHYSPATARRL